MLPRWHILLGALFTSLIWIVFPKTQWYYLAIVFLSSFLIDFDHYAASVLKSKKILSLGQSYKYHDKLYQLEKKEEKRGIRRKSDFHLFHTIEFHILILILGIFFPLFLYVFIGVVFHSILDLISLVYEGQLYRREYFFFNWLFK